MTDDGVVIERKVDLPVRWVKGFGEVGVAQASLEPRLELSGAVAQRFLRDLPRIEGRRPPRPRPALVAGGPAGRGARGRSAAAEDPRAAGAPRAQPDRVRRRRRRERVHARHGPRPAAPGAEPVGVARLQRRGRRARGARVGEARRGRRQHRGRARVAARAQRARAGGRRRDRHARPCGRCSRSIAARGRAGYDLAEEAYFHRDLPYALERVDELHPRLRDARKLLADGDRRARGRATSSACATTPCAWTPTRRAARACGGRATPATADRASTCWRRNCARTAERGRAAKVTSPVAGTPANRSTVGRCPGRHEAERLDGRSEGVVKPVVNLPR